MFCLKFQKKNSILTATLKINSKRFVSLDDLTNKLLTKQIIQQININNALSHLSEENLDPDDDHVRKKC